MAKGSFTRGSFHRRTLLLATIPLLIAAAFAFSFDFRVSLWVRDADRIPGDLRRGIMLAEVFAHGLGVLYILLVVLVLDRPGWSNALRVAACAYLPGLLAQSAKYLVARQRPSVADLDGSVSSSFLAWLPTVRTDQFDEAFDYAVQSFPSGHTATAFGLAIGLGFAYPKGRWLFLFFATLAGLQRIIAGAHYPSDVLVGAAIACFTAPWLAPKS